MSGDPKPSDLPIFDPDLGGPIDRPQPHELPDWTTHGPMIGDKPIPTHPPKRQPETPPAEKPKEE